MLDWETFPTFERRTSIPDDLVDIQQIDIFTDDVAARMGRVLQRWDVVGSLAISVAGLTEHGHYDDLVTYFVRTEKLHTLLLFGNHMISPAVSSAPVIHRILTAVSTSPVTSLTLINTQVAPPSLWKLPKISHLCLSLCTIAATEVDDMDGVRKDKLQTSIETVQIHSGGQDDLFTMHTTNTLNLFLKASEVHSKIKHVMFFKANKGIILERIADIFQVQPHVERVVLDEIGEDSSWFETFINKQSSISSKLLSVELHWDNQSREVTSGEKDKVIKAMNRSSSICRIHAVVHGSETSQPFFDQQQEEEIRLIGLRNSSLFDLTNTVPFFDDVSPQGLWPRIMQRATQSGHPDHTTLLNRVILEHLDPDLTFSDDVMMGKK